jgi:hypothetical protein
MQPPGAARHRKAIVCIRHILVEIAPAAPVAQRVKRTSVRFIRSPVKREACLK